ncbi:hypothetical protein L2E82_14554 [Cichorium intybus]|uniref:Uncharacterized protein n=1 Tax=Cichorium intybus TaxID=13427 RepID=A0ACB9EZQ4_CICIN|nr:hypothetical protein L2E82_14554 [Cichorium intybus]
MDLTHLGSQAGNGTCASAFLVDVKSFIEGRFSGQSVPITLEWGSKISVGVILGPPVGGIGIQGHIDSPVGPVVCSALDKLGELGFPIWFTELDVSSVNECVRADDLEVMIREALAHPAVEGIMIWGFWELFMSRENSHLVNAEGEINEAGNRFLEIKKELLTHVHGHIDDVSEFGFRGFPGDYEMVVVTGSKKIVKKFVVENGDFPLVVPIDF